MVIEGGLTARCERAWQERTAGRWPRWRTRRRRRLVVAALALTVLFMTVDGLVDATAAFWLWPAAYLVWVAVWVVLRVLTSAVADSSAAVLDERERAIRDRLGYRAFTVLILLNAALGGFLCVGVTMPHLSLHIGLLLLSLTLGMAAVPTSTLAWTMPDDDPEDLADA